MEKKEELEAFIRYHQILTIVNQSKRKTIYINLISQLITKCLDYIRAVNSMEVFIRLNRFRLEPLDFQERTKDLDTRRRLAHNALIDQLTITNRNLFTNNDFKRKIPIGGIYSLNPSSITDRASIAVWAGYLVNSLARRSIISPP
jgi:hypothetical protein